jgi:hypothetical protein
MGNGISKTVGTTILTSLNEIFGANMAETQLKYGMLNTLFPNFMVYTPDRTDRHKWRRRTLRHAGWLLTSEVDFNPPHAGHPFPGKNFKKWLRWLTWVQLRTPPDATVWVNGAPVTNVAPAQAIMSTLKMALEDPAQIAVSFGWTEGAQLVVKVVQKPGQQYEIVVTSIEERDVPGGGHDNDEDDL